MRLTYPRSLLSLLVTGFPIVAARTLFALFSNVPSFDRLAGLASKALHSAAKGAAPRRPVMPGGPDCRKAAPTGPDATEPGPGGGQFGK